MQNYRPELGEKRSVHGASLSWLWLLVLCVAPVLLVTVATAVYAVSSFTPVLTDGDTSGSVVGPFACLGGSGLLLALVGAVCLSDFRKWSRTRTVKLVIHERGFTYENQGHLETCLWREIKDINFRLIEVKAKHSSARKVRVIRSVVKTDGAMISLAETLNLKKITEQITTAREKV
jgi:hypothetical protein